MRNAVKRVTHKERSQPNDRKKFGLLEKHKDYIERSTDYKKKQKHISTLKRKASDRNPDEFYFEMEKSQIRKGVHEKLNKNAAVDPSIVDLMKTQDLGYISMKKAIDDGKVNRLRSNLHLIGSKKSKIHRIFLDNVEQVDDFDPVAHFKTIPSLVKRSFNRPKVSEVADLFTGASEEVVSKSLSKNAAAYKELKQRSQRADKLKSAFLKLSEQRIVTTAKGSKRKIVTRPAEGDLPEQAVYKWKRQRK